MMSCQLFSQSSDTTFFPQFVPHTQNPIIDCNDFIVGSWADPTVLKVNNEYMDNMRDKMSARIKKYTFLIIEVFAIFVESVDCIFATNVHRRFGHVEFYFVCGKWKWSEMAIGCLPPFIRDILFSFCDAMFFVVVPFSFRSSSFSNIF